MDFRGIGGEGGADEWVPREAPSMAGFSTGAALLIAPEGDAHTAELVSLEDVFRDLADHPKYTSTDFDVGEKSATDAKSGPPPPKYDDSASTACYTKFESDAAPNTIFNRLQRSLVASGAMFSPDESGFKVRSLPPFCLHVQCFVCRQLKAKMLTSHGTASFTVQLFTAPGARTVVEFRRKQGDTTGFQSLFMELSTSFTDIIAPKALSELSAEELKQLADLDDIKRANKQKETKQKDSETLAAQTVAADRVDPVRFSAFAPSTVQVRNSFTVFSHCG